MTRLAIYSELSDAELAALPTSEILSFLTVAVMYVPPVDDVDAQNILAKAHDRFSIEINLRIASRAVT
jgi:hypothetical protein